MSSRRPMVIAMAVLGFGFLLVWLCLALGACSAPSRPTDQKLAEALSIDPNEWDRNSDPQAAIKIGLLIDTSGSMAGYLRIQNSTYIRVLDQLLSRGSSQAADFRVARFEEPKNLEAEVISTEWAYYSKEYGGGTTELAKGFERIAELPADLSAVIVLSDLVSSSSSEAETEVAAAVGTVAAKFPAYKLAAFRSSYEGKYGPMAHPRTAGPFSIKVGELEGDRRRPFYILLFARSEFVLRIVSESLIEPMTPAEEINYSTAPVSFDGKVRIELPHEDEAELSVFEQARPLGLTARLQAIQLVSLTAKRKKMGRIAVDVPIRISSQGDSGNRLIVHQPERLSVSRQAVEFPVKGLPKQADLAEVEFGLRSGKLRDDSPALFLVGRFPKVPPGSWLAIKHTLTANAQSLSIPEWIDDWSTRDDRSLINANRTLGLDTLARSLANGSPSSQQLLEYIVLYGEE